MTEFENAIRRVTAEYRQSRGLPPLASDEIPVSIRRDTERDTEPREPRMIVWEPRVVINGKSEVWNPNRDYSK